ncbi:MAG: pseudouridine synthase [Thermodesulfobacteriota bacterium]
MSRPGPERLQKLLAQAGVASRRAGERLILEGRVTVNGQAAVLGQKADGDRDDIRLDGRPIKPLARTTTYIFHKPRHVLTTLRDPQGRPSLADFLRNLPERVFPVGRLDGDATGLLILTNDGELAQRLIHPRFKVDKTYQVLVRGRADEAALTALRQGVLVGERPTSPAKVSVLRKMGRRTVLSLTIHEGRHHQVKRMCSQVGLKVEELTRVAVGPLSLGDLPAGRMRPLTPAELAGLRRALGLEKADSIPEVAVAARRPGRGDTKRRK